MARLNDLIRRQGKFCLILLPLLWLVACAPPQQEARKRFFWPPGDIAPKIEYINFYHAEEDLRRGAEDWLDEVVFGKERARMAFVRPAAIASDGNGRVFVADQATNVVQVWDFNKHQLRFLSYASGAAYEFRLVAGLAVDGQGQVYVSDSLGKEIHIFGSDERFRDVLKNEKLERPTGLTFDVHREGLYVVDTGSHQIHFFNRDGVLTETFGKRGVGEGEFNYPLDADVDAGGNLYVLDAMNARVQVFDPDGVFQSQFGERGTALGSFQIPKSIAVSSSGQVYVTDSQAHKFIVFSTKGEHLTSVGGQKPVQEGNVSPGGFYLPEGIAVDKDGSIWVVDSMNRMFHQFQYLNDSYMKTHPILPGQAYYPLGFGGDTNNQ